MAEPLTAEVAAIKATGLVPPAPDRAGLREAVKQEFIRERDRLRAALLHSAEEAHIYGPDHDRRPIFECSYEPCRKARAALHPEDGT